MLRLPVRFAAVILPFAALFAQDRTWRHARPCCTDGARKRGDANFAWVYAIRT